MSAEIEERGEGQEWILSAPGQPVVVSKERVKLPCGCSVFVGLRCDSLEQTVVATECSDEHRPTMRRFNELMAESLRDPQDRRTIEVAQELLDQAGAERELRA